MSRWKAAAIHLSLSIVVGLLILALLYFVWYPQPYFDATGGQRLIIVLIAVDLVLGPMLTLFVFKSGKKGLVLDLCVIAILQVSALTYGMVVIAQARPVFIVAAVDRFSVVAANELDTADLAKGKKQEFRTLSWTGPRLVAARMPVDPELRSDLAFSGMGGKDIEKFPVYYVEYADDAVSFLSRAKPLRILRQSNQDAAVDLDRWLEKHGRSEENVVWLPIYVRESAMTMLIDARTGRVLDALPIAPL